MKRIFSSTIIVLIIMMFSSVNAQNKLTLSGNVDLVSRYIWRGLDIGGAPSVQPSIQLEYSGFSLGTWGAYTLSNNSTATDEIDLWLSYTHEFENSFALSLIITDYTFPNNGIKFFNFNNYDDVDGPGAHLLEFGASLSFGEIPLTLFGYYNFYNDSGNNSYLQIDYSTEVEEVNLDLFCGAAIGSKDNPAYYGTEKFSLINVGAKVTKSVKISDEFSLPIFFSYIINPGIEKSYLLIGISL